MNASRAYARATNETASTERLLVLLLEAALKHMRSAATLLEAGDVAPALPLLGKATDIVAELMSTLNPAAAPELTALLGDVYLFVSQRLLVASTSRTAAPVREAERVFAPVVEGFQAAVAQAGAR
ncbi:MAG: flagellar protein FliS [Myxococcaceae bacterium]|jgi:flagellar biosynthetic protein FliS|nr:flagellar protein FliS [Myxococcaceae bacterium]